MKNNYIFVDFENVQPKSLSMLSDQDVYVLVFVGSNQAKVPITLASSLQLFGDNAEYVQILSSGRNALDFHIAYYMGRIAERDPGAYLHIISRDTGFDPLVRYLKSKGIYAQRSREISEIPLLRASELTSKQERLDAIVQNLATRGHSRPRRVRTLKNTINALFMKALSDDELTSLVEELRDRGYIQVNKEVISYGPPITQS